MSEDTREHLLQQLSDSVVDMEEENTIAAARKYVEQGFDAYEGIDHGLAAGMERAGKLYEEEEYYIPELLMCSDAMYGGLDVLKPYLDKVDSAEKHKVVIGVVEGDTHDIGKNLVRIMMETSGFEVLDLGRDVPPETFVEKAIEIGADLIALSTLMTTTMENMGKVVEILREKKLDNKIKVMVGGGPISAGFAKKIGAYYSTDASRAVDVAKQLVQKEAAA